MKTIKYNLLFLLLAIFASSVFGSCSKEDASEVISKEESLALKAKKFIYDYTSEAYLWRDRISPSVDYRTAAGPVELFDQMKYKELDKWSYVSDDSDAEMESFQGVSTTFGYSLAFGVFSNMQDTYFAVVSFVYKDSPAQKAGLKRGDIILTLAGEKLTSKNYTQLYYASSINIGLGEYTKEGIKDSGKSVSLAAVKMYEDPVVEYRVIEAGGKRTGYLFYAGFYEESHSKLVEVFNKFKQEGVSELILDLRYNPGGNALTPPYLASLFAPESAVKGKKVFLTQTWNSLYMDYFKSTGQDMNSYFVSDIPVNLNLNRVFILTTGGTASASEATISGLMPYMDVVKIGASTYGKYCGAALLYPTDDKGNKDSEIGNWLLSLVVYKFVNINGFTEFKDGISVDYPVEDYGLLQGIQLGDTADPLVAEALAIIGGTKAEAASQTALPHGLQMLPHLSGHPKKGGNQYFFTLFPKAFQQ